MTNDPKYKLFTLFVATLSSFTVWLAILTELDPNKSDPITKIAFFASLMLFLTGILSMVLIYVNTAINSKNGFYATMAKSILRASIISIFIALSLILKTINVLGLLEFGILLLLYLLTELYLRAKQNIPYG